MEDGFNKTRGNKIIIENRLGDLEIEQIKKHKRATIISLCRIKHPDLNFLEILSKLKAVEFYSTKVDNFDALTRIETLESVFLNGISNHEDLSFLSKLTQLTELDLLYLPKLEKFPDLSNCKKLKRIRIWNCKRLIDIKNLSLIPNLEEICIVETPQNPNDLEFLIQSSNIKYIAAQFGGVKINNQFEDLLIKYGKTQYKDQ